MQCYRSDRLLQPPAPRMFPMAEAREADLELLEMLQSFPQRG